jgi:hypothetical protein
MPHNASDFWRGLGGLIQRGNFDRSERWTCAKTRCNSLKKPGFALLF